MLSKQCTKLNVLSHTHLLQSWTKTSTEKLYQTICRKASKSLLLASSTHIRFSGLVEPVFNKPVLSLLQPYSRWHHRPVLQEQWPPIVKFKKSHVDSLPK